MKFQVVGMFQKYGSLRLPVEIVHGMENILMSAEIHSVPLANDVADANLTLLDDIGHMHHHYSQSAVVEAVDLSVKRAGLR